MNRNSRAVRRLDARHADSVRKSATNSGLRVSGIRSSWTLLTNIGKECLRMGIACSYYPPTSSPQQQPPPKSALPFQQERLTLALSTHQLPMAQSVSPTPSPFMRGSIGPGTNASFYQEIGAQTAEQPHVAGPVVQPPRPGNLTSYPGRGERQKMIAGELYRPGCPDLGMDRENCREKWTRFNTDISISPAERARLFRLIIESSGPSTSPIGQGVCIDAPFKCDYGFNITIGKDVVIRSNCYISNPCQCYIGNEVIIGPNVSFLGEAYPYSTSVRNRDRMARARGFRIIVRKGAFIGAHCVIAPAEEFCGNGVLEIGECSYIMPNTCVSKVSLRVLCT